MVRLIHIGDCLEVMKSLDPGSIDAIVTDPPYGLSFMGKDWDKGVPGVPFWQEALRVAKPGCHILAAGGSRTYHRLAVAIEDAGWEIRDCIMWIYGSGFPKSHNLKDEWQGWGTALKPAFEPFILARKPLDGTVAQNVQRHGCGGLNVDGCRIGMDGETIERKSRYTGHLTNSHIEMRPWMVRKFEAGQPLKNDFVNSAGRWPANVIHDGSDEASQPFGSAARFFYCPKASKSEREAGLDQTNHHPTVKPVALMAYLCRLITPPDGTILDPFCGSGSTGVAAVREGFNFIGIELNPEYAEIANRRIENEKQKTALLK